MFVFKPHGLWHFISVAKLTKPLGQLVNIVQAGYSGGNQPPTSCFYREGYHECHSLLFASLLVSSQRWKNKLSENMEAIAWHIVKCLLSPFWARKCMSYSAFPCGKWKVCNSSTVCGSVSRPLYFPASNEEVQCYFPAHLSFPQAKKAGILIFIDLISPTLLSFNWFITLAISRV